MQDEEHSAVTDLSMEGYDPYEILLTLQAKVEFLQDQHEKIIAVINHQSQYIKTQARFFEDIDRRLQRLEELI